jgi:hypothetical protein
MATSCVLAAAGWPEVRLPAPETPDQALRAAVMTVVANERAKY